MRGLVVAIPLMVLACDEEAPEQQEFTTDCTGAQTFEMGMSVTTDGGLQVSLSDAVPAPPDVGDNRWTLQIRRADGAPATGLAPAVRPFMPLHGHGVFPETYAGVEVSDGTYEVEMFDLIMPGLWELHVELPDGDTATFSLCAQG